LFAVAVAVAVAIGLAINSAMKGGVRRRGSLPLKGEERGADIAHVFVCRVNDDLYSNQQGDNADNSAAGATSAGRTGFVAF
jgi:hypothetical protein